MRIETDRLIIRNFNKADATDLYEYLSLQETYMFEPGEPITPEEARQIAIERANGNTFFAVELKDANKMIGHHYLGKIKPEYIETYEIGFIFNPQFTGKGYATESGLALIDYYFKTIKAHKIIGNCNPENTKSWKLLERLGFTQEGVLQKNIFFRNNENNEPIWLNTYVYGIVNPQES